MRLNSSPRLLGRELGHVVVAVGRHDHERRVARCRAVGLGHHHREAWWELGHVPGVGRFRGGRRRLYCDLYCASGDVGDGRSQDAGRVGQVRQVADVGAGTGSAMVFLLRCGALAAQRAVGALLPVFVAASAAEYPTRPRLFRLQRARPWPGQLAWAAWRLFRKSSGGPAGLGRESGRCWRCRCCPAFWAWLSY